VAFGLFAAVALSSAIVAAQPPPDAYSFQAGVFADSARTLDCVAGPAGTTFRMYVWAWAPLSAGANYITLRFRFPGNLDSLGRRMLNPLVTNLIITDYDGGGVEWNFILSGCPVGWILLVREDFAVLDPDAAEIAIWGAPSLARNCSFVLEDLGVLANLRINNGACAPTPAAPATWGAIKGLYR